MAVSGLAAIKELQRKEAERQARSSRPEVKWFKWPSSRPGMKQEATVRFLQELDSDSPNYSEERGLAQIEVEHNGPGLDGFKKRASCTADGPDAECFACDQNRIDYKEWPRAKANLYINALVDFGDGKPEVLLISRPFNNSFVQDLIQENEDEGSITDANYRVIKTGEKTTTKWSLKRMKGDPLDDSEVTELNDIENGALRHIPYDKQEGWYTGGGKSITESDDDSSKVSPDTDW